MIKIKVHRNFKSISEKINLKLLVEKKFDAKGLAELMVLVKLLAYLCRIKV